MPTREALYSLTLHVTIRYELVVNKFASETDVSEAWIFFLYSFDKIASAERKLFKFNLVEKSYPWLTA